MIQPLILIMAKILPPSLMAEKPDDDGGCASPQDSSQVSFEKGISGVAMNHRLSALSSQCPNGVFKPSY
jgi:hypothetical protein